MTTVLHILTDSNLGGAGKWLQSYIKYSDTGSFKIFVLLPEGSRAVRFFSGLPCTVIEAPIHADRSFDLSAIGKMKGIIRRINPDIVHTHGSLTGRIAARLAAVKAVIYTKHTMNEVRRGVKRTIWRTLDNYLCDAVVAVSKATAQNLAENAINQSKIYVVYPGIEPLKTLTEPEKANARKRLGLSGQRLTVAIVARLEPVKDHETFLRGAADALRENGSLQFMIVGGGSLYNELVGFSNELGLSDNVVFTGELPGITEAVNVSDILALTSRSETLGLSLLEGMSLSKPVIAANAGGLPELVAHGENGLLIDCGDSAAFARAVLELAADGTKRNQMGEAGQRLCLERFSPQRFAQEIERLYNKVLAGK